MDGPPVAVCAVRAREGVYEVHTEAHNAYKHDTHAHTRGHTCTHLDPQPHVNMQK